MSVTAGLVDAKPKWPVALILASYVFALFTMFAAVATGVEVWSQWRKAQWPSALAVIRECGVRAYIPSFGRRVVSGYYIGCDISYQTALQVVSTTVKSRNATPPERALWPDSTPLILRMRAWVGLHPPGSALTVHYDPGHPTEVALTDTDMPMGGSRIPDDVTVLLVVAGICGLLQLVGRFKSGAAGPGVSGPGV